jgi:hypothetical protein
MRTTLQPPGHTALQSLPAPRDALMQADAPLMAYLAQWFACGLPASGTRPSNRDLAGRQAVDGSPPPTGRSGTERRRDDDAQAPQGEAGSLAPTARTVDVPRGADTAWEDTPSCPALGSAPALTTEGETYGHDGRD